MGYMKHIWAPWRMKFVETKMDGCIFCKVQQEEDSPKNLVVFRGKYSFVILNRYPYTSGHILVVADQHLASLEDLDSKTRAEMMELATHAMRVLREVYQPQGFNVGANIGAAAGAGIADHVHLHVVPRWTGDSNFMQSLAETRVLPEELDETYRRVRQAWKAIK
jgi:ATP adenylyltransferase